MLRAYSGGNFSNIDLSRTDQNLQWVTFSPDGRRVAINQSLGGTQIVSTSDGQIEWGLPNRPCAVAFMGNSVVWHDDGSSGDTGYLWRYDFGSQDPVKLTTRKLVAAQCGASADGKSWFTLDHDYDTGNKGTIYFARADAPGVPEVIAHDVDGPLAVSPTGERVCYTHTEATSDGNKAELRCTRLADRRVEVIASSAQGPSYAGASDETTFFDDTGRAMLYTVAYDANGNDLPESDHHYRVAYLDTQTTVAVPELMEGTGGWFAILSGGKALAFGSSSHVTIADIPARVMYKAWGKEVYAPLARRGKPRSLVIGAEQSSGAWDLSLADF
jgi:hypothetical protein